MADRFPNDALPTWIPEGLLRAEAGKAKNSDTVVRHTETAVAQVTDLRQEKIRSSIRVSPQVCGEEMLKRLGFVTEYSRFKAFEGKSVLDLGGGFSGFAPFVSRYGATVTVADPVFFEADVQACYETDLHRIRKFTRELEGKIASRDARVRPIMEKNLCHHRNVYEGMLFWREYSPEKFPSIRRVAAYAENLAGIDDASVDCVFACNVIGKPTLCPDKVQREISRVLSPNGRIFTLDNDDERAEANVAKLASHLKGTRTVSVFTDEWFRMLVS